MRNLLFLGFFFLNKAIFAYFHEPEFPIQELFLSEVIEPEKVGEKEFGFKSYVTRRNNGDNETAIPFSTELGITEHFEAGFEWEFLKQTNPSNIQRYSGTGDFGVYGQYNFLHVHNSNLNIAPGFIYAYPTGNVDQNLTDGLALARPYIVIAKTFPQKQWAALFTQISLNIPSRAKTPMNTDSLPSIKTAFEIDMGFYIPINNLVLTSELNFLSNQDNVKNSPSVWRYAPGFIWNINDPVELGIGVPIGLSSGANRYQVICFLIVSAQ